ncbi:MAG: hypothetical protein KTR30_18780 [Saprospiraceae bacterium]|nr:hypothetical protein [Saprospiraceae bacterium]
MSDREILEAIRRGDRKAERYFYEQNRAKCSQYALQHFFWKTSSGETITCKPQDVEELYNDACVVLIQNILRSRIQLDVKISTYLITTMKYAWFNKARAVKRTPATTAVVIPEASKESMRENVRKAIHLLDQKCREMMTYRYIMGWEDYDDIAKATGKNNGDVVRNLISRCRKRFREQYVQVTNLTGI